MCVCVKCLSCNKFFLSNILAIFLIFRMVVILPASWFPMDPADAAKLVLQNWATNVEVGK